MLCSEKLDRWCGCLTRSQTVPQNPDKPFLAPSRAQNCSSMIKTVIPGIANWRMSSLIAFRTIPDLCWKPFFAIAKSRFPFMFWEAEAEVGGVLARANMRIITTITAYPSHQIRSRVERPNESHNLPLRCESDSPFAPTETLKIAPFPRAALHRSGLCWVGLALISY